MDVIQKAIESLGDGLLTEHSLIDRISLYRVSLELTKDKKQHNEMLFFLSLFLIFSRFHKYQNMCSCCGQLFSLNISMNIPS